MSRCPPNRGNFTVHFEQKLIAAMFPVLILFEDRRDPGLDEAGLAHALAANPCPALVGQAVS
jgi:hypothetical protein